MDYCDTRIRAYKNGKTFDQSKQIAETISTQLTKKIKETGMISWNEILQTVDHDELVYKLTLKYLRRNGFDIGNWKNPRVTKSS